MRFKVSKYYQMAMLILFFFIKNSYLSILENFVISSVYLDKSLSFTDVSECDVNLTVSSYNI